MTKINVSQAKQEIGFKQSFRFVLSSQEIGQERELAFLEGPVNVTGTIVNNGRALEVFGIITTKINQTCSRCLDSFTSNLEVPFTEYFQDGPTNGEDDVFWYQGDWIDTAEVIRENLLLAIPIKAVCKESCRGLCPVCGANLNKTTCSCETYQVDTRLAVLKKLLNK